MVTTRYGSQWQWVIVHSCDRCSIISSLDSVSVALLFTFLRQDKSSLSTFSSWERSEFAFIPSFVWMTPTRLSLFKEFLVSVFTSFRWLNNLSTAAFEDGRDIMLPTTFFRLGYFSFPLNDRASSLRCQNFSEDSSRIISSNSSNACFLHSTSTNVLSATSVKYGNWSIKQLV